MCVSPASPTSTMAVEPVTEMLFVAVLPHTVMALGLEAVRVPLIVLPTTDRAPPEPTAMFPVTVVPGATHTD